MSNTTKADNATSTTTTPKKEKKMGVVRFLQKNPQLKAELQTQTEQLTPFDL